MSFQLTGSQKMEIVSIFYITIYTYNEKHRSIKKSKFFKMCFRYCLHTSIVIHFQEGTTDLLDLFGDLQWSRSDPMSAFILYGMHLQFHDEWAHKYTPLSNLQGEIWTFCLKYITEFVTSTKEAKILCSFFWLKN